MSMQTWAKQYFDGNLDRFKEIEDPMIPALEHSIRKWRGLSPAALQRHGLKRDRECIFDEATELTVSNETCALCFLYLSTYCYDCPLHMFLGCRCDETIKPEDFEDSYRAFTRRGDNRPMLKALRGALKMVKQRQTIT